MGRLSSGEGHGNWFLASRVSLAARLSQGRPRFRQAAVGTMRSCSGPSRSQPVRLHIVPVTAAAAPPQNRAADGTAEADAAGEALRALRGEGWLGAEGALVVEGHGALEGGGAEGGLDL